MSVYATVLHLLRARVQITCMHRLAHMVRRERGGWEPSVLSMSLPVHGAVCPRQTFSIDAIDATDLR